MSARRFGHIYRRGSIYWIRYAVGGKRYRESSESTKSEAAEKLLARREAELGFGKFVAPDMKRTSFEDLATLIRQDYAQHGHRSTERLEASLKQLARVFAHTRAVAITRERIARYIRGRLVEAKPATVRNEVNALRRAFRLAFDAERVARVPPFPPLPVHNTRTGFFEAADLDALVGELPPPLRPVIRFAALTGWRIPSEVLRLTWPQVDFDAGVVRLEAGTTKNGEARTFPFDVLPDLATLLREQRALTTATERRLGALVPWVFHRNGRPIRDLYSAWKAALTRAATMSRDALTVVVRPQLIDRIPHDLRRTAVRALERAGVSRSVAMSLTGHKTESVYRRYAITDLASQREGVAKLAALRVGGTMGAQTVTGLR